MGFELQSYLGDADRDSGTRSVRLTPPCLHQAHFNQVCLSISSRTLVNRIHSMEQKLCKISTSGMVSHGAVRLPPPRCPQWPIHYAKVDSSAQSCFMWMRESHTVGLHGHKCR